jgi:Malectin domain
MRSIRLLAFFLLIAPLAYGQSPIRIAAGQNAPYTDTSGNTWAADTGYNVGAPGINWPKTFSTTHAIAGASDPTIFQHERWNGNNNPPLIYTFQVPSGAWTLNLYFSENFATGAGQRIFNVKINGNASLTNFDIFAAAGGEFTANLQSFQIISSGTVAIEFDQLKPAVGNPKINAIEFIPVKQNILPYTFNEQLRFCTVCDGSDDSFTGPTVIAGSIVTVTQSGAYLGSATFNASGNATLATSVNASYPDPLQFSASVVNPSSAPLGSALSQSIPAILITGHSTFSLIVRLDATTGLLRGITWSVL